ncbi:unnamed protein product, partial [Mesorhabditis belari]|uniref:WD repeat-containing protein 55 homolog n=1 Tax=Mesorhabditis belari TaxID=2138241 RepID=A0AAF3JAP0_9BILA
MNKFLLGGDNGKLRLYNIRTGKLIHEFQSKFDAPITVLEVGRIANVHKGAVTSLYFMPAEPIMVSTSSDNSMRTWVLDQMDGMPRQLVINEGHSLPVKTVIFSSNHEVVSAGLDGSVRKYSVMDAVTRQKLGNDGTISRAKAKKKGLDLDSIRLEPVIEIAVE